MLYVSQKLLIEGILIFSGTAVPEIGFNQVSNKLSPIRTGSLVYTILTFAQGTPKLGKVNKLDQDGTRFNLQVINTFILTLFRLKNVKT